jgi:predicted deacylase
MAVKASIRGKGIGGQLITSLLSHCKQHKLCRVLLTTANPQSAQFYSKCGFKMAKSFEHTPSIPDLAPITFTVSSMVYYIGAKIIRRVGLVGGTHGNELLGVELVKGWQLQAGTAQDELRRSTLKCVPVLSNLPAIAVNRRFIDKDLNRQFKRETLDAILRTTATAPAPGAAAVEMEDFSAARLNALLGPKTEFYTEPTKVDFIVDMHSSTSNLGNMLILGCLTHDNLAAHTAFTVKQRLNAAEGGAPLSNGTLRVASTDVTKEVSHWVDRYRVIAGISPT